MRAFVAVLVCSAAGLAAVAGNPQATQAKPGETLHIDRSHHWRISYPSNWLIERGSYTQFTPESKDAVCGVHIATRPPATTNQLTDEVLRSMAASIESQSGIRSNILSRRTVNLLSGESANDVLVDLIPGGRSRRLFTVASNGLGYLIDCETEVTKWQQYQPAFESMFKSFRIDR